MKKLKVRGLKVIDLSDIQITFDNLDVFMEYLTSYRFEHKSEIFIVSRELLPAKTFDKSSKLKEELLQMCINYNTILIVIGEYDVEEDSQLNDFIYACNNGKHMFLVQDPKQGIELLKGIL